MKFEYKERVLENLNSIDKRVVILLEMLSGKRYSSEEEAIRLLKEISKLVEMSNDVVNIS
jgi:hypothetical protein